MRLKSKMNKKAMFFTLLVLSVLSLFLLSYTFYSIVEDREPIQKRVETLNNFVFSTEKDLVRQLYISGFRIIFLFERRIAEQGDFVDNVTLRFNELFFNTTLYGITNDDISGIIEGVDFSGINETLQRNAGKINAIASLANPSLTVGQEDPWHVKVTLTADLSIKDNTNLVSWDKTTEIIAYIPIENFEDPIYVKETSGKVTNKINKTIYQPFVDGNDVSNLTLHVNANNSLYIASSSAPSFLDRLQGNMSANVNGIESLVYLPKLSAQGIDVKDKSSVDYIYFSINNPTSYQIQGMPSWFKLDNESSRLDMYGVSQLAY